MFTSKFFTVTAICLRVFSVLCSHKYSGGDNVLLLKGEIGVALLHPDQTKDNQIVAFTRLATLLEHADLLKIICSKVKFKKIQYLVLKCCEVARKLLYRSSFMQLTNKKLWLLHIYGEGVKIAWFNLLLNVFKSK